MSPLPPRSRREQPGALELAARRAAAARDAGLARVGQVTRWAIAGIVGLAGALALLAAQSFHGHTASGATSTASGVATPAAAGSDASTTPSNNLQAPSQAPAETPVAPVVVSGGS